MTSINPADRARPETSGAAAQRLPRTNAEGRQFAAMLIAQMNAGIGSMGGEGSGGEEAGEGGGEFTMPDFSSMMMLPMMGALGQAKGGAASSLMSALGMLGAGQGAAGGGLLSGDASAEGGDAGAVDSIPNLQGLLNAPVGSAGGGAPRLSLGENVSTVAAAARRKGVDPALAVAMMLVESGGNERAVGDGGTSFGLYQLHRGGMLTAAGLSSSQAFDPATNADVALGSLSRTAARGRYGSPGELAAASQRPADRADYAAKVNAALARARGLLGG